MRAAGMEPLETYPGAMGSPWRSRCTTCGAEGSPRPNNLSNGAGGCKPCGDRKRWGRVRSGDLTGQQFGSLTVLGAGDKDERGKKRWVCRCSCGRVVLIAQTHLVGGKSKRCRDCANDLNRRHGLAGDPLYHAWHALRSRCNNPDDPGYQNYGGRGITVCERWAGPDGLQNFLTDMASTYRPGLSIDRIDNDGPYSPENCRWATSNEQGRNRRSNVVIRWGAYTRTAMEWSQILGMGYGALWWRLNNWDPMRAMTQGVPSELITGITGGQSDCRPEIVQWRTRNNNNNNNNTD